MKRHTKLKLVNRKFLIKVCLNQNHLIKLTCFKIQKKSECEDLYLKTGWDQEHEISIKKLLARVILELFLYKQKTR